MLQSRNPTLTRFDQPARWEDLAPRSDASGGVIRGEAARTMTLSGTLLSTAVLLGICAGTAVLSWNWATGMIAGGDFGKVQLYFLGSMIGTLLLGLVISFLPKVSPFLSPVYAAGEGVFLAFFSAFIAYRYLGAAENAGAISLIAQAVFITFAIAGGMLLAYASGLLRVGGLVKKIMMTMMFGLMIYAVVLMVGNGLLGANIPNLYSSASPIGIGFTALCVGLASLFLVLDFQHIEEGVKNGHPKYMEWYAAFGLLVTLVWLYIEVLRLLAKLRSND
jgi:uncharacterized YccA/Bax inhibitor family protein